MSEVVKAKEEHVNIVKVYKDGEEHNILGENLSQFLALGFTKDKPEVAADTVVKGK